MSQTGDSRCRREITCELGEAVMGQLIDEIITLLALGDTRHPDE